MTRVRGPLLLDVSNSFIKAAVPGPRGGPALLGRRPTSQVRPGDLREWLRASGQRRVLAASVVPRVTALLQRWRSAEVELVSASRPLNFALAAGVQGGTVGADRLANMAAAAAVFGRSCIVGDFGTAATLDVLDARGRFAGGIIAPGLGLVRQALARGTALLPLAPLGKPRRWCGRNTGEALAAGVAGGYGLMIAGLVARLSAEHFSGSGAHLVFTGGDAALVRRLSGLQVRLDPRWTLRGLAALAAGQRSATVVASG